jgi:hypothetical protein
MRIQAGKIKAGAVRAAAKALLWGALVGLGVSGQNALRGAEAPRPRAVQVVPGVAVMVPATWQMLSQTRNAMHLVVPAAAKDRKYDAHVQVTTEVRRSHAEAVRRLAEIAAEEPTPAAMVEIAGWPAVERRRVAPVPVPGAFEAAEESRQTTPRGRAREPQKPAETGESVRLTTAIAAGDKLIRFETTLSPKADPKVADLAAALSRQIVVAEVPEPAQTRRDLEELKARAARPRDALLQLSTRRATLGGQTATGRVNAGGRVARVARPGLAAVRAGNGELEVAVANDGQAVVVAGNGGTSWSSNAGASFSPTLSQPCTLPQCAGDLSVAVGQSGAFYASWIGTTTTFADTDGVSASPNGGQNFVTRSTPEVCSGACVVPDQPHIAADRLNVSGSGQDQVYLVERNFVTPFSDSPLIICSTDGGKTWGAATSIVGDFPRVSVGSDGSVYVVFVAGGNVTLDKFSSCATGLVPQLGGPITVAAFNALPCPVAGLDRCNAGNVLASPTVAVDDLDPNHVFVAFATSTGAGNENVLVVDSEDGGAMWPRSVQVNQAVTARRFLPWLSTYGGVAYVGWYDRRSQTAANNDLTRYYGGSAWVHGGNLLAGPETDVSQVDDPECGPANTPWCTLTGAPTDATQCSVQPQIAGKCNVNDFQPDCDFNLGGPGCTAAQCLSGSTAGFTGGCPKYGDYNGFAAMAGGLYHVWASATPPPGVAAPGPGINVYEDTGLAPSDFYVRDWTDSATSFDSGVEPSTHADFWDTSDVWNQVGNVPEAPAGGFVLGDSGQLGTTNFAFARVSRRAPAAPNASTVDVTAHFLFADYGLGSNFNDLGSETITFSAADSVKISPAHSWTVPAGSSSHVCIAVEIEAPGDPYLTPSLSGLTPVGDTPLIVDDNNKAQRNFGTVVGSGLAGLEQYAIVHNGLLEPTTMNVQYEVAPEAVNLIKGGTVGVVGQREQPLGAKGTLVFNAMQPGENRWIKLVFGAFSVPEDRLLAVHFSQADGGRTASGFTMAARSSSLAGAARENLVRAAAVHSREAFKTVRPEPSRLAFETTKLLAREQAPAVSETAYAAFVREHVPELRTLVADHLQRGPDHFGLEQAAVALEQAVAGQDVAALAVAHHALLQRLDVHLTMLQKQQGDPADVLQNVRWQAALFAKLRRVAASGQVLAASERFVEAYGRRELDNRQYPDFLAGLQPALADTARQLGVHRDPDLAAAAVRLERSLKGPLAGIQKAHHDYLLRLQQIVAAGPAKT